MDIDNQLVFKLLGQVKAGSEPAMREIYQACSRGVYAFVLRRLRDPFRAEEVLVDTMHEVWKHPDRFRGESKFSTWLLGIAQHKLLEVLRSRGQPTEELDEETPSEDTTAFDTVAAAEQHDGVRDCMDKLSDEHRECLHLAYYEDLSIADIAQLQGIPQNTVKTRLFHARQKIRNCLRKLIEGVH